MELDHCVGAYTADCEAGSSHILSVRGPGASRSTLEIGFTEGHGWWIKQHRGMTNAVPTAAERKASRALHEALTAGSIVPPQEVHDYREYYRERVGTQRARATPWQLVTHLRHPSDGPPGPVWEEWRHILGGAVARADDPGVLYRNPKVRDLVGVISPDGARRIAEAAERAREQRAAPAHPEGPAP